jgi:hypothetical protein
MEPKPDYWTFNATHAPTYDTTIYPVFVDNAEDKADDWDRLSVEEKVDRLKEIVLPRLAALESRQPVRLPLEFVQWDGLP